MGSEKGSGIAISRNDGISSVAVGCYGMPVESFRDVVIRVSKKGVESHKTY